MQNAAGSDAAVQFDGRNDGFRSIVSDLESLIERVQASMKLLELAIAREAPSGNQEVATDIVVLDDVTPRYLKANTALNSCNAGLGIALHFLLDTKTSKHATNESAGSDRRPAHRMGRA
jgi:hypothetical protein